MFVSSQKKEGQRHNSIVTGFLNFCLILGLALRTLRHFNISKVLAPNCICEVGLGMFSL